MIAKYDAALQSRAGNRRSASISYTAFLSGRDPPWWRWPYHHGAPAVRPHDGAGGAVQGSTHRAGGAPAGSRDSGASADVVDYPEQPLLRPLALLHAIRRRGRLETAHRWRRGAAARIDARRPESGAVQVDGRHVGVRRQRPRLL